MVLAALRSNFCVIVSRISMWYYYNKKGGDLLSNQYQYQTGDKLPEGTYVCMQCADNPQTVIVPEMCERLPECPHCGHTYWYKV